MGSARASSNLVGVAFFVLFGQTDPFAPLRRGGLELSGYTDEAFVAERLRRYVQVVVNFVGAGSSPVECMFYFF